MEKRRPERSIWLDVVPPPTPVGTVKRDEYSLASVFATTTRMADHESLEAGEAPVEEELK